MGELATRIRAKYPGAYDSLPDAELESKIVAKYPGVYDHLVTLSNDPASYPDYPGKKDPAAMRREFMRKEKGNKTIGEKARDFAEVIEPIARPTISGSLSILGGAAGLASPVPGGTLAGGTLGYAGGQQLGDLIFGERGEGTVTGQLKQGGRDVYEGLQGEVLGLGLGAGVGASLSGLSRLRNAQPLRAIAEKRARPVLQSLSDLSPREAANAAKSEELTKRLGVELTPAQRTGKPSLQSLEQQLAGTDPEFAATLNTRDAAAKQAALSQIQQKVGKARPLPQPQELMTTGQDTIEAVTSAQSAAKPIHEELYKAIPNTPQPTDKIKSVISQLKKNFRPGDEEVYPSRVIARIEEALSGPKPSTGGHGKPADPVILDAQGLPLRGSVDTTKTQVGFQDLHSLRKDIGRQIQDATTGAKPNRELAAKLTTIKNAIDDTIEETMGADNQYKAAKDAFIDYAGKYRTGAVDKVLRKGNESSGLRIADENINRQFFTPSGAAQLKRAVGAGQAKEQMRPFVVADILKAAAPDGVNFNTQTGINYIQKNRAALEQLGLVQEARQILKDQFPAELERMLAKRAPDATTGQQFFTAQDMRGILQKYGNTIKQLYGADTLQSFRDYNMLMGMIERKNLIPRSAGSNTAEKFMQLANSMIAKSGGPEQRLTEGLLSAILQGTGAGGALGYASGQTLKSAAAGATIVAGRQLFKNVDKRVAQIFGQILKEATLNPQMAKDLMAVKRTGKVPFSLSSIIDKLKDQRGLVGRDINADSQPIYYRRTSKPNIYNDVDWAMFADDAERVAHYGDYEHTLKLSDIPPEKIVSADDPIFKRAVEKALIAERSLLREYQATPKKISSELNPHDIVNSAQVWDNPTLVDFIWNQVLEPMGKVGVKTQDGFLLFDNSFVAPPAKKGKYNL